ncbi:hypothetical protein ACLKA6_019802 [Drosophila palustris]
MNSTNLNAIARLRAQRNHLDRRIQELQEPEGHPPQYMALQYLAAQQLPPQQLPLHHMAPQQPPPPQQN